MTTPELPEARIWLFLLCIPPGNETHDALNTSSKPIAARSNGSVASPRPFNTSNRRRAGESVGGGPPIQKRCRASDSGSIASVGARVSVSTLATLQSGRRTVKSSSNTHAGASSAFASKRVGVFEQASKSTLVRAVTERRFVSPARQRNDAGASTREKLKSTGSPRALTQKRQPRMPLAPDSSMKRR